LLRAAGGELEGSEEEDGTLPDVVEREERLHAAGQIRAGQRKLLKMLSPGAEKKMEVTFFVFLFTARLE